MTSTADPKPTSFSLRKNTKKSAGTAVIESNLSQATEIEQEKGTSAPVLNVTGIRYADDSAPNIEGDKGRRTYRTNGITDDALADLKKLLGTNNTSSATRIAIVLARDYLKLTGG